MNGKERCASFIRVQLCNCQASDGQVLCPGLRSKGARPVLNRGGRGRMLDGPQLFSGYRDSLGV
jgi:hypothetical protein